MNWKRCHPDFGLESICCTELIKTLLSHLFIGLHQVSFHLLFLSCLFHLFTSGYFSCVTSSQLYSVGYTPDNFQIALFSLFRLGSPMWLLGILLFVCDFPRKKKTQQKICFRDAFTHSLLILKLDISWRKRCSLHHGWRFPDSVCAPTPRPPTKTFCHHQELRWYYSWQEYEQWLGIVLDLKESQRWREGTGSQRKPEMEREYWISKKDKERVLDLKQSRRWRGG